MFDLREPRRERRARQRLRLRLHRRRVAAARLRSVGPAAAAVGRGGGGPPPRRLLARLLEVVDVHVRQVDAAKGALGERDRRGGLHLAHARARTHEAAAGVVRRALHARGRGPSCGVALAPTLPIIAAMVAADWLSHCRDTPEIHPRCR